MTQKRTISIRALSIIAFIVLVMLLAPILISSIYNRPINDDLVQPYPAKMAYRETGSVFQVILASIRETCRIWNDYSGIFSSMFLSVCAPYAFSHTLGYIHPILFSALLIFSCYKLVSCLRLFNKDIPSCYVHLLTPILSIAFLTAMPNITEGLFWYSSAANYLFFFSISLLLFSSLLKTACHDGMAKGKQALLLAVYCIGFFFLGGCNWITSTSSILVYSFFALYIILQKKDRIPLLLPFLFLLAGYALAIIAPGNFNRQQMIGDKPSLPEAFILAFFKALSFCFSKGTFYLFPLLMLPVFARLSQYMPALPKHIWLLPVASICIIAACFFPMVYTAYYITYRHENIIYFIFTILLSINELVLVSWLAQRCSTVYQKGERFILTRVIAVVAAFALTLLAAFQTTFTLSPVTLSTNYAPLQASVHLLMGYTKNYATSYDDLVDTLRAGGEEEIMIESEIRSPIVGGPDFQWFTDHWVNTAFVKYYTDENTLLLRTRW